MKNLNYILFLSFLLAATVSFGQFSPEEQLQLDSFNSIVGNPESHDTSLAAAYVGLSEILYISNLDTLKYLCVIAKNISEKALKSKPEKLVKLSLQKSLAAALNNIGYFDKHHGDIPSAFENYNQALKIQLELNDKINLSVTYNNIGGIYIQQGDIPLALENYHNSLRIREEIGDKYGMANSYNNLGYIHMNQDDFDLALDYYHKSLNLKEDTKDKKGISNTYNNIGQIHEKKGNLQLALEYYQKCLEIDSEIKDKEGKAISYNNIGGVYRSQGDLDLAIEFYKKSLELREEIEDKNGIAISYNNIAIVAFMKGEMNGPKGALSFANKSLLLSKEMGFISNINASSNTLSKVYFKQGNYKKALEMRNLEIQMRDSLASESALKAAISQQAKYEYEKRKGIDDKENEKKVAIEKEAQKRQFIVLVIVIIASALVLVLLIIIYRRLRITRKQKFVIEEQKEEVESQRDQIEGQKNEIEEKHEEIQESITYAKRIQNAILPPDSFMTQHLPNNFVYYQPKDVVAGDFYWMEVHDDIVFFAAADCTGHGVPGAMVSVVCHNALNRAVREFGLRDAGQILDKVRELVLATFEKSEEQMKDGMDICLCALNKKSNNLQFSGANNPLYLVKEGKLETIKGTKQPIGHVQDPRPFECHNINLTDIHSFYLTTDGYADQFGGPKNKKFSYKQLRELLLDNHSETMNEQHDILRSELNLWIGQGDDEQIDDICMIGIQIV